MQPETSTPPPSGAKPAGHTSDTSDASANGLLRAVELGLRRVLGQADSSKAPSLTPIAEPLARVRSLEVLQRTLAQVPGVVALHEEVRPSRFIARAASGCAILFPHQDGWIVVCGGGVRAPRVHLATRNQDRRISARRLRNEVGDAAREVVIIESQAPLEALSERATGSKRPLRRLAALLRLEARDLVALTAFAVTLGGMSLAVPVAVQVLVNTIALGSLFQPLVVLALLLFGVLTFAGLVQIVAWYAVEVLQRRVFVRVAEDFARRLIHLRAETHDRYDMPELVNRFFETVNLQKALSRLLLDVLGLVLQSAVGLALLAFYHPVLLAFDVGLIFALVCVGLLGFGAVRTAVDESRAKYAVAHWLESLAAQPLLLTGTNAGVVASVRADALTREYLSARRTHYRRVLRQLAGGVGVQVFAMVALLGIGGWLVMEGELTLGQLVAAELVVGTLAGGFGKIGKHLEAGYDLLASLDKLGRIIDLEPQPGSSTEALPSLLTVELHELQAGIDGGPISAAVSAALEPGGRYRLAGAGASGKSAMLEILAGYREPISGRLTIPQTLDDPSSILRNEATLLRGHQVFPLSVIENLRFGDPNVTESRALNALRVVGLADRVASLPARLDTKLLASGAPFSRSELVRLGLARAWLAQPRLLLVDGAFDHLGLTDAARQALLVSFLGPEREWTVVATSDDPVVQQYLSQTLCVNAQNVPEGS